MKHLAKINGHLNAVGLKITSLVGTMWCAVVFTLITLISLPGALASGSIVIVVQWVASVFLQLVLLSIIMVGQNASAVKTEARDIETHDAVMQEHADIKELLATLIHKVTTTPTDA